jgi:RNA polymerase sigma-70 factor (ECF subfamily)
MTHICRDNRTEQFSEEALPHRSAILRTARRLVRGASADDIAQEVFLRAWRKFDDYRPGTDCKAWLFGILFRTVAHHRRKESRPDRFGIAKEPALLAARRPVQERLTDEDLIRMMGRLHPNQKLLIELVDIQGFSYRDAAGRSGVPIGTVMSRLCRGRKRLRDMMAGEAFRLEASPWPAGICLAAAD